MNKKKLMNQLTIAKPIEINGVGLHTGVNVKMTLKPAPANTGYVFVRTDLDNFELPASVEYISHCSYATTLLRKGVLLSTCEHVLAGLRGSHIDNCFLELDNIEIPIMDGSSEDFIQLINAAGITEQNTVKRFLKVLKKVEYVQEDRKMSVEPSDKYEIDCLIDFKHPMINVQTYNFVFENGSFGKYIAAARTFGFEREIEMLRKANLALGGSLDNAIVLTETGMLNPQPLRYENEFVRHKILDIVGDLALLGMPLLAKVKAEKSGHAVHASLMSKLLKTKGAWEIIEA